jgi:hypothetical protein
MLTSTLHSAREAVLQGTTSIRLPGIEKVTTGNGTYTFPKLGILVSDEIGEMEWYAMAELARAAQALLVQHGMKEVRMPIFETFHPDYLPCDAQPRFSWMTHNERSEPAETLLCLNGEVDNVGFDHTPNLYVSKEWGNAVLACAREGIVELEEFGGGRLRAVRWNGSYIQHLDLRALLQPLRKAA